MAGTRLNIKVTIFDSRECGNMKGPELFDTMQRKKREIIPRDGPIRIFTCGPSIYARPHIGNFRTFIFQDLLVRYLRYREFDVLRAMNLTDVEDKAIWMAQREGLTVKELTERNEKGLWKEWDLLRMERPDRVPRSSESIELSIELIKLLLHNKIAYKHGRDIFYDPTKFHGFGRLFGLDMSKWPEKKRRFSKDTYPGIQWNLGDFILWHGCGEEEKVCWDEELGSGRPSWNVQDAAMCWESLGTEIDIWCGGWDNLWRPHDYNIAVMEGAHGGTLANYWYHGGHLLLNGKKMSKSKGNVLYVDDLMEKGFEPHEIRFYLAYGPWRKKRNMTIVKMEEDVQKLRKTRNMIGDLLSAEGKGGYVHVKNNIERLEEDFISAMDDNLDFRNAFDSVERRLSLLLKHGKKGRISQDESRKLKQALKRIDKVMMVFF
jgi:cysteinyl-tRNA synthetase